LYKSAVTEPTRKSISFDGHQNAVFTVSAITTLTGQGPNVRAPGLGLLYQDVGRLVVDPRVRFAARSCSSPRGSQLRGVRPWLLARQRVRETAIGGARRAVV
jgi:hypothetical protein